MNIFTRIGDLLFDQRKFFAEEKTKKCGWAFLIVLISAAVAAVYSYLNAQAASAVIGGMETLGIIMTVSAIVTAVISTFISWIVISLIFFICLKLFGHSDCKFGGVMRVEGYVLGLFILQTVLLILVSFIGTPAPIAVLLLSYVFYAWAIPVWYNGFKAISTKISDKGLKISIAVPVIILAIFTLLTSGVFS